jgi:hypothetical protein
MMKRFGAILLSVLYIVTVAGFALNLHFCCDELTSVSVTATVKSAGACKIATEKCCSDKRLVVKVNDPHYGQAHLPAKLFALKTPALCHPQFLFIRDLGNLRQFFDKRPPDPPMANTDAILKNRILRI